MFPGAVTTNAPLKINISTTALAEDCLVERRDGGDTSVSVKPVLYSVERQSWRVEICRMSSNKTSEKQCPKGMYHTDMVHRIPRSGNG